MAKKGEDNQRGLTDQQRLFVAFYLQKQNASWAAKKAGYSEESAGQLGWQLLQNPSIKAAIREGFDKLLDECNVTAGRIVREYERIAFQDITSVVNWDAEGNATWTPSDELTPDQSAGISEFTRKHTTIRTKDGSEIDTKEYRVKQHDKMAALSALSKMAKLAIGDGPPEDEEVVTGAILIPADSEEWRGLVDG